jgi:hypothetical protein
MAEVEIQDAGRTVLKERIPVYQYGPILTMPVFR